jgi:hypothetical protein
MPENTQACLQLFLGIKKPGHAEQWPNVFVLVEPPPFRIIPLFQRDNPDGCEYASLLAAIFGH